MNSQRITLQEWVSLNPEIEELLFEIQNMPIPIQDQAQIAFDRLAELLGLMKDPGEINQNENKDEDNESQSQRSLFEEHALLKYLEPDNDPRSLVLSSVFHLFNGAGVAYEDIANKRYDGVIPQDCIIGIRGQGINSEVVFPREENASWYELGCKTAIKI